MRTLLLLLALAPAAAAAAPLQCHILPPTPVTPADKALAAGDLPTAESLYASQLNYPSLVRVQLERNELTAALDSANKAISTKNSAEAQAALGDVLLRSGHVPEANAAFSAAIALDPCSPAAHFGRARVAELSGRHAIAATELAASHPLAPADAELTAAYLRSLPPQQRLPPIRAFLASSPTLLPSTREALTAELAILSDDLTCTPVPFQGTRLNLQQIFLNGRDIRSWGLTVAFNENTLATPVELDSSVDGIVLSADDAAKAHVRPLSSASPEPPYLAAAPSIRIGNLEYRNCPVRVVPNAYLNKRNSLIGTNFFRDHLIHIDYVAMTVTLTPLPTPPTVSRTGLTDQFIAPEEKNWTPVYVAGPDILIPTMINKKGPFLMGLDTGSARTIISPTVNVMQLSGGTDATLNIEGYSGRIIKVMTRDGGYTIITDVHGPDHKLLNVARPLKLPVFRFAGNEADDRSVVAFDISPKLHEDGIEAAGFLGFYLLRGYAIDLNYRDALVQLTFDQNRRYEERILQQNPN